MPAGARVRPLSATAQRFRLAIDRARTYIPRMSRVASKSRPLPRWRITRIKARPAVELGTVEAPDADIAIQVAIKEFEITNPEHQGAWPRDMWG